MLRVPLTKIERNENTVIFFIFLFLLISVLNGLFILPQLNEYKQIFSIIYGVFATVQLLTFSMAALRSPGYIKRDSSIDFQELLDTTDPYNL